MIEITDSAARVIARQSAKSGAPAGGLRVAVKAGGCSGYSYVFRFEPAARDTDQVFDGPGGVKVFVDPRSLALLEGTVLDFDEGNLMATNFTVRNPNAKSACGCGTSFSV
ncbi:MAG TPA: iron-sulfur cluster assembly accessory protein [Vicinamibacterales bacterium]|nr:iron-sulfur cluster assembly accessory protein [Vicinamibacterales bacterium]